MTPSDPSVLRRKLAIIVENLKALEPVAAMAPSAGLRNRLVHEYDAIVDAIVLDAVRKAQSLFPQYVAAIERYLLGRFPSERR